MSAAVLECPACGHRATDGSTTCPHDGTPLRPVRYLPANEVDASAEREPGSPRPLFIWVAIVFVAVFTAGMTIVVWMNNHGPQMDPEATNVHPPVSFETARMMTRLDRLEYELREAPDSPQKAQGLKELKVLRVRVETTGAREDLDRLNQAIDDWERTYLLSR